MHVHYKAACHAVGSKTEDGRVFHSAPALYCAGQSSDLCEWHLLKGNGGDQVTEKDVPFLLSHSEVMKAVHVRVCLPWTRP